MEGRMSNLYIAREAALFQAVKYAASQDKYRSMSMEDVVEAAEKFFTFLNSPAPNFTPRPRPAW